MYDIEPRAIFAHERVYENPRAVARMERMLAALGVPASAVETVTAADAERIAETAGATDEVATEELVRAGHGRVRQGILKLEHDPVLVFNTFVWDEENREPPPREFRHPQARRLAKLLAGVGADFAFSRRDLLTPRDHYVCQGGWGIHTIAGCVHKCDYCMQGFLVVLQLDLEDFCDRLRAMFRQRPEQKLYRYDLYSDVLCFEPEYGASAVLGECFDETDDKYLLLYTRSDNVEYLLDLPWRTHTLANWTLSMDTVCRTIERDSPPLGARIEAMRKCREAGYVVRAGFSPIVPVRQWRRETTGMLELLFSRAEPEVLRCWVLAMMDADEFERIFDTEAMDPAFMRRMRQETDAMRGQHEAPFPLDVRAEIYAHYLDEIARLRPEMPVALCTEHPKLWEMLEDRLRMTPGAMFCCCGGLSAPGGWRTS